MDEDALNRRAQEVQSTVEARHGKDTTQGMINAVGKQGFNADFLRQVVTSGADNFENLGTQSLLQVMQSGSPNDPEVRAAEANYSQIRNRQRENWRIERGRR
jgi:hypothetical protein